MATNFRLQIKRFMDEVEQKTLAAYKRESRILLYNLVDATPVDTGRLKANWRVGAGKVNMTYNKNRFSPRGSVSKREGSKVINYLTKSKPIYITNRTPYGARLNFGTSHIYPRRFVEQGISNAKVEVSLNRLVHS